MDFSVMARDYKIKPQTKKIWRMYVDDEMSVRDISSQLGLAFGLVNSAIRRGRESGAIPPRKNKNPRRSDSYYIRLGSISAITEALDTSQLYWLLDQAKVCGCETVSEYILECVRDSYFEATHKKG